MTEQIIAPAPGICFNESYYAASKEVAYVTVGAAFRQGQNRWSDGYNVEFIGGYPQKIAGWAQIIDTPLSGAPRCLCVWRSHTGAPFIGVGTDTHLYYLDGTMVHDITPLRMVVTGTLTDPFTTTINNNLVQVADPAATLIDGDLVYLKASNLVAGLEVNGWYGVLQVNPGIGYQIDLKTPAVISAVGGGTVTYKYPRITLTDPFTTTEASNAVTVTHIGHGATPGDYVVYGGATEVGGLTLTGELQIAAVTDLDHYIIAMADNATTSETGGGSVNAEYLITVSHGPDVADIAYSSGSYGLGAYSASGLTAARSLANGWTLAAYGNQLLSNPIGGSIYIFDSVKGGRSYPMENAPLKVNAMFVTPERFVVALGLGDNQMELAWSDQTDYTIWTTDNINTANTGRTLVGGSFLVAGIAVRPGQSLIYTDRCVFVMTYTGGQNVYSTLMAADNCGLLNAHALCCGGGVAFWMGDQDFWTWNGSATALPSDDVRAKVFHDLNRQKAMNVAATMNRKKKQVRFFYPSGAASENTAGIVYHYDSNAWSPLSFGHSAAADANLMSTPVSADVNGLVYYEETGVDANGVPLPYFLQLGMTDLSNGDRNADVFGFTPDFLYLAGSPDLTILTQYYPSQVLTRDGPFQMTPTTTRIDLRSDGKLFSFSLGDDAMGCNFRLGLPRLDIGPAGARR